MTQAQMVPPRVQMVDGGGFVTPSWYRFLAALFADSPGQRDMRRIDKRFATVVLTGSAAAVYTAPFNTRAVVGAAVLCNTTAGAVNVDVWLVPSGQAAGNGNAVLRSVSIAANASRAVPEIVGQVIEGEGSLQAAGSGVTFIVSGEELA